MNKKSILGLLLFSCVVIAGMFFGTMLMIGRQTDANYNQSQQQNEADNEDGIVAKQPDEDMDSPQNQSPVPDIEDELFYTEGIGEDSPDNDKTGEDKTTDAPHADDQADADSLDFGEGDADDNGETDDAGTDNGNSDGEEASGQEDDNQHEVDTQDVLGEAIVELPDMQLIKDSTQVDYMSYIPDMVYDSRIETALDIVNPEINIKAKSAILFDAVTGKVLYYKDPVVPVFPASTAKLLTALVALDWCMEEEEVTVGDELDLVASDSTVARLRKGHVLTIRNLLEGMLVPSGNDAAYVIAAYMGRKSLKDENASLKDAIPEFIRLMNDKAKSLGTINSNFKTPDGYDAIGQYTTAYDMGLIGLAAADNEIIAEICNKNSARNVFADGSDVTWSNTNSLIARTSGRYYSYCSGLKTGTSTMAGRCLISVAKKDGREVVSVVMNSDAAGRWEDSTALLKFGLKEN